jgi:hypothetical protein
MRAVPLVAATLLWLPGQPVAWGALIAYEGFDYPVAVNGVNAQSGGTGFSGAWDAPTNGGDIVASTLAYTDGGGRQLVTGGQQLYMDSTNAGSTTAGSTVINFRPFNTAAYPVGVNTFYFSMLGQQLTGDARAMNVALFMPTGGGNGPGGSAELISVGHGTNTPDGGPFNWGAFATGNGASGAYSGVSALSPAFLVLRVDLDVDGLNDRVRLYVNPDLDAEPAVASVDFQDRNVLTGFGDIGRVRPFAGNSNGTFLAAQAHYDELRLGTTWEAVTPHLVPEPTSAALFFLGLIALRRARR